MEYIVLTTVPDESIATAWNECLDHAEFAGLYTAPEYFKMQQIQTERPIAVLAVCGPVVHGIVTGVITKRRIDCGHSGSPQVCIRDGSDRAEVATALISGLKSKAFQSANYLSLFAWEEIAEFRAAGFRLKRWEVPLGTVVLDLSKGADTLLRECTKTRRYNIKHALKAGVEVTEMDLGRDFDEYYTLYKHWCAFKGRPPASYELQRAMFEMRDNRLLLVARHLGRIVGVSTFRFRQPGIIEYAANVSRREDGKLTQNDLLVWRAIEWAIRAGDIRYFSMAGAHLFLQRFGGKPISTYGYSLDRSLFRVRDLSDIARSAAITAYRALPPSVISRLRKLRRAESAVE